MTYILCTLFLVWIAWEIIKPWFTSGSCSDYPSGGYDIDEYERCVQTRDPRLLDELREQYPTYYVACGHVVYKPLRK